MSIRTHSRQIIIQCLFQWSYDPLDPHILIREHTLNKKNNSFDLEFITSCVKGCIEKQQEIDTLIETTAQRHIKDISPMELAILRLGEFEIKYRQDIPYKVSITECIELSHKFGGPSSHKFINHVLDTISKV